jgi:hypothetical protein
LVKLFKILGEGRLFEVIFYPLAGFVFVGVDGTGTGAWLVIISSTIVSIKKIALKLNKKILEVAVLKKMLCLWSSRVFETFGFGLAF